MEHYSQERKNRSVGWILAAAFLGAVLGALIVVLLVPSIYPPNNAPPPLVSQPSGIIQQTPANIPGSQGNEPQFPAVAIGNAVSPAVVGIANFQRGISSFFGAGLSTGGLIEVGSGSGFIVDAQNGYIVTNNHVIEGAENIMVSLADGRNLQAVLIGADARTDLAVLKIDDTTGLTAVSIGDSKALQVGEPVVAIGNPGGQKFARSLTQGIVSATDRFLELRGEASFRLIQTDAAINPGNSGGPLVNFRGQVIGINAAKTHVSGYEGMGFAIPISDAIPVINQLIEKGYASHAALMISINESYTPEYASYRNMPQGCYVARAETGGGAEKAGIRAGDIITAIAGVAVKNSLELTHELFKFKPGDTVDVTYYRNNESKTVQVVLGELRS